MVTEPPHITPQGKHPPGATTPPNHIVTEALHILWGICRHEDPLGVLPHITEIILRLQGEDHHHLGITPLNQEVAHPQGKIFFLQMKLYLGLDLFSTLLMCFNLNLFYCWLPIHLEVFLVQNSNDKIMLERFISLDL